MAVVIDSLESVTGFSANPSGGCCGDMDGASMVDRCSEVGIEDTDTSSPS